MKIKDRLEKLIDAGMVTVKAIDKAREKGWITAKQRTDMNKKVDALELAEIERIMKRAEEKGIIEKGEYNDMERNS